MGPSPFREELADVDLKVTAGSPLAEVFLINHAFALVERSIGDLSCTVEPGAYTVKAKLGDAVAERLVLLDGDADIDLAPDLRIGSAAPIEGTAWTRPADMDAAAADSGRVVTKIGDGAQVFVMARLWDADTGGAPPWLSLHGPDETLLAKPEPSPSDTGRLTVSMTIEADPGPYFLRWSDGSGVTAEQAVHAVAGWQTQVFVTEDAATPAEIGRTRVSILMTRGAFDPRADGLRLVEEARTALADERKVAADFLTDVLLAKLENPILSLFAAHLMVIARDAQEEFETERSRALPADDRPQAPVRFDQREFDRVVEGLRDLLGGDHPDVAALATQTTDHDHGKLKPLTAPPMLWRSWLLLIEASNDAPRLVPVEVWRRVRRLLPLRPFLLWSPSDDDAEADAQWTENLTLAMATAKRPPEAAAGARPMADMLSAAGEEASRADPEAEVGDETRSRVSRQLLVPRAAIDEIASRPTS